MVVPGFLLITTAGNPHEVENVPVESNDNDAYLWSAEENDLVTTWAENYPDPKSVDGTTYEKWDLDRESDVVQPMPPWLASILGLLIGAIFPIMGVKVIYDGVSSNFVVTAKSKINSMKNSLSKQANSIMIDVRGVADPMDVIFSLVISLFLVFIGIQFFIQFLPKIWGSLTSVTGSYWGLGYVMMLIPFFLVFGFVYGIIKVFTTR
jgi:hypothetical protein